MHFPAGRPWLHQARLESTMQASRRSIELEQLHVEERSLLVEEGPPRPKSGKAQPTDQAPRATVEWLIKILTQRLAQINFSDGPHYV